MPTNLAVSFDLEAFSKVSQEIGKSGIGTWLVFLFLIFCGSGMLGIYWLVRQLDRERSARILSEAKLYDYLSKDLRAADVRTGEFATTLAEGIKLIERQDEILHSLAVELLHRKK